MCDVGPSLGLEGKTQVLQEQRTQALVLIEAAAADQGAGWGEQQVLCLLKEKNNIVCGVEGRGAGAREFGKGLPTGEIRN